MANDNSVYSIFSMCFHHRKSPYVENPYVYVTVFQGIRYGPTDQDSNTLY